MACLRATDYERDPRKDSPSLAGASRGITDFRSAVSRLVLPDARRGEKPFGTRRTPSGTDRCHCATDSKAWKADTCAAPRRECESFFPSTMTFLGRASLLVQR